MEQDKRERLNKAVERFNEKQDVEQRVNADKLEEIAKEDDLEKVIKKLEEDNQ